MIKICSSSNSTSCHSSQHARLMRSQCLKLAAARRQCMQGPVSCTTASHDSLRQDAINQSAYRCPEHSRSSSNAAASSSGRHGMPAHHVPVMQHSSAPLPQLKHSRRLVLYSCTLPMLLIESDPATIVNSVLGAYGLPNLMKMATGYKSYDVFENNYSFEYPRAWVARENSLRQGIIASDFQTADKAQVEVFPAPADQGDIVKLAVAAAVVPGGASQQDDKLSLPSDSAIKRTEEVLDGVTYIYLRFPSDTITCSGYNIRRKHLAVVAMKGGFVYTLDASARSDQYNKDKEAVLKHVVESFRVR